MSLQGIRTLNPSKRAAANTRLKPRCAQDRLYSYLQCALRSGVLDVKYKVNHFKMVDWGSFEADLVDVCVTCFQGLTLSHSFSSDESGYRPNGRSGSQLHVQSIS
jgi:hypothetical protein